ncbi:MAG: trypsin-like peptidase domain-containing protein [Lachnospiraceae bacterium]|nr:trypsin-like peptidase domain-containing protein [Lachnospiraceae bacterium]
MSYDPFYGYDPDEKKEETKSEAAVNNTQSSQQQENRTYQNYQSSGNYQNNTTGMDNNGYQSYQTGQNNQNVHNDNNGNNPNFTMYGNPYATPPKKEKKQHPFAKSVGKAAAIAVVFGMVAGLTFQGTSAVSSRLLGTNTKETIASKNSSSDIEKNEETVNRTATSTATTVTDVSQLVDDVMPSIVQVTNMSVVEYQNFFGQSMQYPQKSAGSGVIVDQDKDYLYIATNNHVVAKANSLTITFNDESAVPAEVQGTQASTDLAVVKVKLSDVDADTLKSIKVANLGDSTSLKVGSPAIVIGNALGYGQSVTKGIVSALEREVSIQNEEDGQVYSNKLIQVDAAVNPGNSGGALLNMNGELVGIVSAKYSDEQVEGMGYAIPISQANDILRQLMKKGTADEGETVSTGKAYLGVSGVDIGSDLAATYNMPTGVYVAQVMTGTPAEKAGIAKGDVITSFEGTAVTSMQQLSDLISAKKVGDKVKISIAKVQNNYDPVEVEVELGEKPADQQQ